MLCIENFIICLLGKLHIDIGIFIKIKISIRLILDYRLQIELTAFPMSLCIMSSIDWKRIITCLILWNNERSQKIEPATGGWFLWSGGASFWVVNRFSIVSTSFWYCTKISRNFCIIWLLIASLDRMCLNFSSKLKAPSAERRDWNDSSMNILASFSMAVTSRLKWSITFFQFCELRVINGSKETWKHNRKNGCIWAANFWIRF